MHRKIFLTLCAAALFALPSFAQTTNLNGTWKLDNAKSSFGQFPPPASETDMINIDGSSFKQQVTSTTQQGSQSYTRACTIDGQEKTLSPDDPNAHIGRVTLSKIKCEWQGPSLVVTETANLQGSDLTDRLTFTASDDRKSMTMDSHITSATINGGRKLVYDAAESSAGMTAPSNNAPPAGMTAATSGSHPSLAGVWKLNIAKSNFGQGPAPTSQIDTIEDNEPTVKIVADQKGGFMGDTNITTTFSTDGKPTTSAGMGGAPVTSTAHWEGGALVTNSKTSFQGSDITIKDTLTPSADEKTFTETTHVETSMGNFDTTSVFDKQ